MATRKKKPAQLDPSIKPNWGGEGWGDIRSGEKVNHYYRDGQALCHRVGLYRGALEADTGIPGPDDCGHCRRRLTEIGAPA